MFNGKRFEAKSGMIYLPGGTFQMGSTREEVQKALDELPESERVQLTERRGSECPKHDVFLSPFYIDKYPVTQAEFVRVMGYNPSLNKSDPNNPVDSVTQYVALEYCERVGKRLPTEAEWEYACRGGTGTKFFWGDDPDEASEYAWHGGNSNLKSQPVGLKKPNPFGLYDMLGNVWEWCSDFYDPGYYELNYAKRQVHINPQGPDSIPDGEVSIRGGSFLVNSLEIWLRCAVRGGHGPDNAFELNNAGFRCACSALEL